MECRDRSKDYHMESKESMFTIIHKPNDTYNSLVMGSIFQFISSIQYLRKKADRISKKWAIKHPFKNIYNTISISVIDFISKVYEVAYAIPEIDCRK